MSKRVNRRRASLAAVLGLLIAVAVHADPGRGKEIEGVLFPGHARLERTSLLLHAVGLLRYRILFKAYVAGLYLSDGVSVRDVLGDVAKRLEIHYFHGIAGDDFGAAAEKILERNFDAATLEPLRPRMARLAQLYQDVEPGDRYTLTYLPGVGTQLALNGRVKGTIPGADFAAAYFSIWLGDDPIDRSLRDQLLGKP